MSSGVSGRVYCPVCQASFRAGSDWKEGDTVVCPVCGQRLSLRATGDGWTGDRVHKGTEKEIRDRAEEFARIRAYAFNDMKDEIIEGLMGKMTRFGDFYCPCRMEHGPEYQCPCKPTRGGDVETNGRCHCGFFWKQ